VLYLRGSEVFCLARSAVAGRGEVVERGPGSSGTPAVSGILHIGVDTSGEATVVTPSGCCLCRPRRSCGTPC